MGKLILLGITWFLIFDTAFAFQCQQCSYFDMRILDIPSIPGLPNYANLLSSMLSQVASNDTSCLHGNSSARMECGDLGCALFNLFFMQAIPIFENFTIKLARTVVQRSCRNPTAPPQSGCVPVTLDNQIQVGPNTNMSIRQLINQRTGSGTQGGSPTIVEVQGQTCHCYGVDNCNNAPNGTTTTMPTTTGVVTMPTNTVAIPTDPVALDVQQQDVVNPQTEKAISITVTRSASGCAALSYYLLSCILFSRL
ncbi:uncharacterized protein LOC106174861 [Lingula anatina]|uniref:Uncharacterized protein LOC106174861 n=1 Tax=Lingula anatina TaxID=7574 RepID=A0A1S3JPI1_LINAN|nr:uncharacterized protein LOC106174861 [Lingula anatina]|eukprot:XP_013412041.1 uncharacterized protein LOC106174861 [Lingula anatina]